MIILRDFMIKRLYCVVLKEKKDFRPKTKEVQLI